MQGDIVNEILPTMPNKILASTTANVYIKANKNDKTTIFMAKLVEVKNDAIVLADVINFQKNGTSLANNEVVAVRVLSPGDYPHGAYMGHTKNIAFEMTDENSEFLKNNEVIRKDFKKRDLKLSFEHSDCVSQMGANASFQE